VAEGVQVEVAAKRGVEVVRVEVAAVPVDQAGARAAVVAAAAVRRVVAVVVGVVPVGRVAVRVEARVAAGVAREAEAARAAAGVAKVVAVVSEAVVDKAVAAGWRRRSGRRRSGWRPGALAQHIGGFNQTTPHSPAREWGVVVIVYGDRFIDVDIVRHLA
jgi:hypothetical protein